MSRSFSLLSLFIVFLVLDFHGVHGDLISDVCKNASTIKIISPIDNYTFSDVNYDFCVASFSTNPASKGADLLGLGKISLETCLTNVTSIHSYVADQILNGKQEPPVKLLLEDCYVLYTDTLKCIQIAIEGFEQKDYARAHEWLEFADIETSQCEDRIKGLTPLTKQSDDFRRLIAISFAIVPKAKV
ncbi:hypothetical protein MKW94_015299 [Papaver nudicaule]|uniref:Pectinesterase inhibitor domain-containing protein n=1 Tax=Papaver nudicaule TaxID=74823 RepID=A0AA41RVS9_PAPNU|nr:hypothetical protein [Papaver nudicaule]